MIEYRIMYTVNGKGYTKTDAWIHDTTNSLALVVEYVEECHEWLTPYGTHDVWVESRRVEPWERVDVDSLT